MELKVYMDKLSNLTAENRLLKFVVAVIGCAVLANTFIMLGMTRRARTILVPPALVPPALVSPALVSPALVSPALVSPGLSAKVEISGDQASDGYLELMTRYVTGLALNYTPATAREQFGELLALYSPSAFPEAKKTFYALAGTVETANVSSVFTPGSIKVDRMRGVIDATGVQRQFAQDGGPLVPDKETTYEISYRISGGRFELTGFSEKGGTN